MNYEKDLKLTVLITNTYPYDKYNYINEIIITYYDIIIILTSLYEKNNEKIKNSNLLLIFEILQTCNLIFFKFICSNDCNNGVNFINDEITLNVINFLKELSYRENTLIEFSDHSLASLVNNWDIEKFKMNCPIIILDDTTSGYFEMKTTKSNFLNSSHNKLITIGKLSKSDNITIIFNNTDGTKIYEIVKEEENNIKVLSTGISIEELSIFNLIIKKVPVHSEFKMNKSIIIISLTHWCNLYNITTPLNLPKIISYTKKIYGKSIEDELDLTI
jgi:hypothetical protein